MEKNWIMFLVDENERGSYDYHYVCLGYTLRDCIAYLLNHGTQYGFENHLVSHEEDIDVPNAFKILETYKFGHSSDENFKNKQNYYAMLEPVLGSNDGNS